jgi:hypothetical protein
MGLFSILLKVLRDLGLGWKTSRLEFGHHKDFSIGSEEGLSRKHSSVTPSYNAMQFLCPSTSYQSLSLGEKNLGAQALPTYKQVPENSSKTFPPDLSMMQMCICLK